MTTTTVTLGSRVSVHPYGPGTITRIGNVAEYPKTATATVAFDSGKRYVVLAKRMRAVQA